MFVDDAFNIISYLYTHIPGTGFDENEPLNKPDNNFEDGYLIRVN